jgi:hypothetical protein
MTPAAHPANGNDDATSNVAAPADSQRSHPSQLVVWGAHGGAGTTTLATWLQPAWDMGAMRPEPRPRYPASVASGRPLIVTCRNTAPSTAQATKAVTTVNSHAGHVAVLAVISDGWPEPPTATSRLQLLEPLVGAVIRVPFVPGLRLADDPAYVPLSRSALRALDRIRAVTGRTSPTS